MKFFKIIIALVTFNGPSLPASADNSVEIEDLPVLEQDNSRLILVEPFQLWRNSSGECVEGEYCWSEIPQQKIRDELSLFESETVIHKINSDGSLSYLVSKVGSKAGQYRVTQYAMIYMSLPCKAEDPDAGIRRVGAGVRVTAKVTTKRNNLNLSGFIPLAVAASRNWARGEIRINSWGLSSSDNTVSTFLDSGGLALDEAGIQSAIESMAVARVLLNDKDTKITPWTLAVKETSEGSCSG